MLSYSSNGLAGAALVSGKDFNCNATICYGIGAQHQTMLKLQALINKYASAAGFKPIAVDGKIGDGTTVALWAAAKWIIAKGGAGSKFTVGNGKNATQLDNFGIAQYANDLISTLDFWSTSLPKSSTPAPKPPVVATAPAPAAPSSSSGSQPGSSMTPITLPSGWNTTPSSGSFGPGRSPTAPAASTQQPQVFTVKEPTPWWVWAVGGVILVGGVGAAVVIMRPKKDSSGSGTAKVRRRRAPAYA